MAKGLITFKSNFSFKKLSRHIDSIVDENLESLGDEFAAQSRENIDEGVHPELSASTLRARELGHTSFSGHNPSPSPNNDIPLKYTGRLYNSLKGTKAGVEGESYGLEHERGFKGTVKPVPARPFLAKSIKKDKSQKINETMISKMNKAMRK